MQNDTESKIKQDLHAEIQHLEQNYKLIKTFLSGKDYEANELAASLQAFKDSLSRASAFIMALYNLKGKRVNIPWEPLFTTLDYALATIGFSSAPKQKAQVKVILSMAESQIEQVMAYFSSLKESLK
jgi:hypothetical protein